MTVRKATSGLIPSEKLPFLGGLATLLATVAATGANIVDVSHVREGLDLHVRETAVELVLETRGHEHAQRVLSTLRDESYQAQVLR